MAEEIDFENGSNFEGLVTLTFNPAIRHIILQQSSTSTYVPTFIQIEETFCGRTDVRTDIFPLYTIRSTFGSRPKNALYITHFNGKITHLRQNNVGALPFYTNPLEFKGNYSATSNNMKLVHWSLMGGLFWG